MCTGRGEVDAMYLPHVCAGLPDFRQELETSHPFFEAETCFSCKVVKVLDQSFHNILGARVGALGIDELRVFGNVFNIQIFEMR